MHDAQEPRAADKVQAEPIAIIGIDCMFPKAKDLASFWQNIRDGVDAITETPDTHWKPDDYYDSDPDAPDMTYGKRGGFLDAHDFDPLAFGISPRDVEATDTSQLLGMVVAKRALEDAGYPADGDRIDRDRVSVVLGVTGTLELVIPLGARLGHPIWRKALEDAGVDQETAEDVCARIADGYVPWQENSFPGLLGNVVAGRIANRLDLHGTNCVVDAACASSLSAVHLAILELQSGRSDMVVTGGVDTFNDIFMYMCFSKTPALSPTGDARPFAEAGDGTILGEGVGMLVLKRLADAERDGDEIYAVIKGLGTASDGKGDAVYAPTADGQARCLRNAYENADVDPATVELVEAHGTGTKVGDATEIRGLTSVYGDADRDDTWCALGSVKSMIGHTKAAAGAAGVIKAALALHKQVLPPTLKVDRPNEAAQPGTTPFYVNTQARPWIGHDRHPRRAAISAFGFGGSNFHCVLEEYRPDERSIDWDDRVQLLALSGADAAALRADVEALHREAGAADDAWQTLCQASAASRVGFTSDAACRLVVVLRRDHDPLGVLEQAAAQLASNTAATWSLPSGVEFAAGARAGDVAFVFPGQGSQKVGMLRDLMCRFPVARDVLAAADRQPGANLTDHVFPHPAFDDATRTVQSDALRRTDVAQPAIGAVSLGTARVLEHFGVRPDATTGHSYGELTALCVAGRLSESEFHRLSRLRGELMAAQGEAQDAGSMLAVMTDRATVDAFLAEHDLDLIVANRNAPEQFVLSGETATIDRTAELCKAARLRCKKLQVAAAFHSPLVAEASEPFRAALEDVVIGKTDIPVYANTTAEPYADDVAAARALLAGQLKAPVEFEQSIRNLRARGVTTFVEVGPGRGMKGLVDAILQDDATASAIACDNSGDGLLDLARVLAHLAARGHAVDLAQWNPQSPATTTETNKKPAFTMPLNGANYMAPREPRPKRTPQETPRPQTQPTAVTPEPAPAQQRPTQQRPTQQRPTQPQSQPVAAVGQDQLAALLQMQQQTAELHRRFLEGQQQITQAIHSMLTGDAPVALPPVPLPQVPQPQVPQPQVTLPQAPPPAPVAPAPTPEPVAATPTPAPAAPAGPAVAEVLLAVVAEKTGYPQEMLELSMGLDSDLGIDSIKRVEILSALQERLPDAPVVKPEHLGELQTLGQIVEFLGASAAPAASAPAASAPAASAPAASAAAGAPAAPTTEISSNRDRYTEVLVRVVAAKTGYPEEMLELSMGLDADLGIDSIKRVEILSALQEELPQAPVVKPEHLGELLTLAHIVDFLAAGEPVAAAAPTQAPTGAPVAAPSTGDKDEYTAALVAIVAEKTGYPEEMLELSMGLDADLGIDSIKRVEILSALQERLPAAPVVKPEHLGELQTLGHIVDFLTAGAPPATVETKAPTAEPEPAAAPGIARHVVRTRVEASPTEVASPLRAEALVWVTRTSDGLSTALVERMRQLGVKAAEIERTTTAEPPTELAGLVLVAPDEPPEDFLHQSFALTRHLGAALRRTGEKDTAWLATVSRLDGAFGFGSLALTTPVLSGGLAGLTKTVGHEWPGVQAIAMDTDATETDHGWLAERVVGQLFASVPGEFGIARAGTSTLELETVDLEERGRVPFTDKDVVVITGGARGVTAEVAIALAEAAAPRLVLLGRSGAPTPEPDWLRDLEDETSIKQAILARAGTKLSPRELGDEYETVRRNREVLRNIARMEAKGSRVAYAAVDVRDAAAVQSTLHELGEQLGPITGLIHGAGVLADKYLADKTDADFDRVYGTKIEGLQNLLAATAEQPLKALVMFSSSTARFGRTGQADYAVANEVLNKIAQHERRRRPDCRVVSCNWGPWDGGMVTPALRDLFAGEGISVIDLTAGASYLLDELAVPVDGSEPVEVVLLGSGSTLPGVDTIDAVVVPSIEALPELPQVFTRAVDLETDEFLRSHVLDGKAVLPAAVMLEWLAHGALHGNPGLRCKGLDDFRVFKGVRLSAGESIAVRVCADKAQKQNGHFVVATELCSTDATGKRTLHARANAVLAANLDAAPDAQPARVLAPYRETAPEAYASHLFHGEHFQGLVEIDGCDDDGIVAVTETAHAPRDWSTQPVRSRWIADPLALDASFQAMILWSFAQREMGSLPTGFDGYRQFCAAFPKEPVRIEARIVSSDPGRARADIDWLDAGGQVLARMTGYECVLDASLAQAFQKNALDARNAAER